MPKILYSPGFGAGWTTWHSGSMDEIKFMLTYQPFIDALERGEGIKEPPYNFGILTGGESGFDLSDNPLVAQFVYDFQEKFPDARVPYLGGVDDLTICEVSGPFRIEEYDGSESVVETYDDWIVL